MSSRHRRRPVAGSSSSHPPNNEQARSSRQTASKRASSSSRDAKSARNDESGGIRLVDLGDSPSSTSSFSQMAADNAYLLESGFASDLSITCHDSSDEMPVHRAVLAARSTYFRLMLTNSSTAEAQSGTINIADFGIDVFRPLLAYLYQGRCSLPESLLQELFVAADKYQLLDLKDKCERELRKSVRAENALDIALLAQAHNAELLKAAALETIAHWPDEIGESAETFDKLAASPALLKDVLGMVVKTLRGEKEKLRVGLERKIEESRAESEARSSRCKCGAYHPSIYSDSDTNSDTY